ncbi:MAG TPA: hypothetical protein VGG81_07010 [Edaphobacter sp.]|jgi:hypothetical protein
MSTLVDNEQLDKATAEQLISTIPLIPEVESIDVQLYTDHDGDPSFQLIFHVRREVQVDKAFIRRYVDFTGLVQTKILHSDLNRFPYTRLEQAA